MKKVSAWLERKDDVSLGKLLKEVENQTGLSNELLKLCYSGQGKSHVIGITGPPGAGKSTLVSKLCKLLADQGLKVGIVCVDPTSPFTQGALLGDRVRMQELAKLPNVFIKSLATRGNLGGLAASTADIVQVLDSFDFDVIVIETVGVGQIEFDVLGVSDTVVLVNVPGLGDTLQTLKAGIMEIADLFVINQADRPGADESVKDLKLMVRESARNDWNPPILKTIATTGNGIKELMEVIFTHKTYLENTGGWEEKREYRNLQRLNQNVIHILSSQIQTYIQSNVALQRQIQQVKEGVMDPFSVSHTIVEQFISK